MEPTQPGIAQPTQSMNIPEFKPDKPRSMDDLMKQTWKSTDLVRVKNIDNEPFEWDAANPNNDHIVQPDKVTYEVYRSQPEHYTLEAGETNVYYGYAAYIMVDQLYRRVLIKNGRANAIGVPDTQKEYLDKIFLGVVNPLDLAREQTAQTNVKDDVAKDLEVDAPDKSPNKPNQTAKAK